MKAHSAALCEQLLMLLLDDDGKLMSGSRTDYLLGGAVLSDLVIHGRVDLAGPDGPVKAGRVHVRSMAPTGDVLLDTALERVQRKQGSRPRSIIPALSKGTRRATLERLTAAGTIRESRRSLLGMIPVRSWPPTDPRYAAPSKLAIQKALDRGMQPDPRTAALIALLVAGDVLHKVQPTTDRKAQKQRARLLTADDWVAAATRKALQDSSAVVAGV